MRSVCEVGVDILQAGLVCVFASVCTHAICRWGVRVHIHVWGRKAKWKSEIIRPRVLSLKPSLVCFLSKVHNLTTLAEPRASAFSQCSSPSIDLLHTQLGLEEKAKVSCLYSWSESLGHRRLGFDSLCAELLHVWISLWCSGVNVTMTCLGSSHPVNECMHVWYSLSFSVCQHLNFREKEDRGTHSIF